MATEKLHAVAKLMVSNSKDRKDPCFGKGAATLLHGVEENGSLNKTAKEMGMAYSKAWTLLKKVEEGLGFDLIERHGARGSVLTKKGAQFLALYDEFEAKVENFVEEEFNKTFKNF